MDLHGIVGPYVGIVNPPIGGKLARSAGYTTGADGRRSPAYDPAESVKIQAQELTMKDLRHLEGLNVQGSQRAMYLSGSIAAVSRANQTGGDLITLDADGSVWLTTAVLERWPDWCKVSVTQQIG